MSNELNNIIARNSDGVYEGVAIGGDRYPGTRFIDHLLRYQDNPTISVRRRQQYSSRNYQRCLQTAGTRSAVCSSTANNVNKPFAAQGMWGTGTINSSNVRLDATPQALVEPN